MPLRLSQQNKESLLFSAIHLKLHNEKKKKKITFPFLGGWPITTHGCSQPQERGCTNNKRTELVWPEACFLMKISQHCSSPPKFCNLKEKKLLFLHGNIISRCLCSTYGVLMAACTALCSRQEVLKEPERQSGLTLSQSKGKDPSAPLSISNAAVSARTGKSHKTSFLEHPQGSSFLHFIRGWRWLSTA